MDEERIAEIVNDLLDHLNRGEHDAVEKVLAEAPEARDQILGMLSALRALGTPEAAKVDGASVAAQAPAAAGLEESFRLGGYEVLEKIGAGGMGIVYKAAHRALNRIVALKVLPFPIVAPDDLARFRQEAKLAARLKHPGIVAIHDFGSVQGLHYYTMDYIEGRSLKAVIQDMAEGREPRELPEECRGETLGQSRKGDSASQAALSGARARWVAKLGVQAARALAHAHEVGVIHRDIKPSNMLLDAKGDIFLCDFGLARDLQATFSFTGTGEIVGTPAYMSPEQIEGKRKEVDQRTDVYSLALSLYEAVTLKQPFLAPTREATLARILRLEPPRPRALNPAVSPSLEAVIFKGMARNPDRRYATAKDFADDLERLLEGRQVSAPHITRTRQAVALARRRKWELLTAGLLVALLAAPLVSLVHAAFRALATHQLSRRLESAWQAYESSAFQDARGNAEEVFRELTEDHPRELHAQAHFIVGASSCRLCDAGVASAENRLGEAMLEGEGSEWDIRAQLALVEAKMRELVFRPAEEWLPSIVDFCGKRADDPLWRGLGARAALGRVKLAIAKGEYVEARQGVEALLRNTESLGAIADEARALSDILKREPFLSVNGAPLPNEDPLQLGVLDLEGDGTPEIALLTREGLHFYRQVQSGPAKDAITIESVAPPFTPETLGDELDLLAMATGDLDGEPGDEIAVSVGKSGTLGIVIRVLRWNAKERGLQPIRFRTELRIRGEVHWPGMAMADFAPDGGRALVVASLVGGDQGVRISAYDSLKKEIADPIVLLDDEGTRFGFNLNAVEVADITGDGSPEILLGATGSLPAGYGLRVFARNPAGEYRPTASFLAGKPDNPSAEHSGIVECRAAEVDPRAEGPEILASFESLSPGDAQATSPFMEFGGLVVLRYDPGNAPAAGPATPPSLRALHTFMLARAIRPRNVTAANLWGGAGNEFFAVIEREDNKRCSTVLVLDEAGGDYWAWPFALSESRRCALACAALDVDGDEHAEIMYVLPGKGLVLDLSP